MTQRHRFSLIVIVKPDSSSVQVEIYTLGLAARDRTILMTGSAQSLRLRALFIQQFQALWNGLLTKTTAEAGLTSQ